MPEFTKQWIIDCLNREREVLDEISKSVRGVANLAGEGGSFLG
jgi:hypothetical protein